MVRVGSTLFFSATNNTNGFELWRSNGTAQGTLLVKDINPGGSNSSPARLTDVNGTLFFTAEENTQGRELWKSDGTTQGTVLVKDIYPGNSTLFHIDGLTNLNGTLFFRGDDGTSGIELWRSDGTAEGTQMVKDINPNGSAFVQIPTVLNGALYFSADNGSNGFELWKSDGTATGTQMVKDIYPGVGSSSPGYLTSVPLANVGNTLFFSASSPNVQELWRSDGTAAGTVPVPYGTPNNRATFEIVVKVNEAAASSLVNTASITSSTPDIDPSNNESTATTSIIPLPRLNIDDLSVIEGNNSTGGTATFTITLSKPSTQKVSVNAIPVNGSAQVPGDYTAGGVRLIFQPGEITKSFSVLVKGDLLDETNEVFYVLLSSPVNAVIAKGRGTCIIADDDVLPSISIEDLSLAEGNEGQRVAAFRLRLSAPSGQVVKVRYATAAVAPSIFNPATAGDDYTAVAPTEIAFPVGQTVTLARVLIQSDQRNEPDEGFLLNLTSPVNATLTNNQGFGIILNDDAAPSLSINDVSLSEGNSGTKNLTFTVTLSKASGETVTVNYASANGIARAGSDYTANQGTLSFAPGSALTRTVSIAINGDAIVEGDETLFVLLSGAVNASIGRGRGVGMITNDDASG